MLSADLLLVVCLLYVALLFMVAYFVDRKSRSGQAKWLHSPVIFTLSISVYCTSWTFYGAVGSAARNGLEFITIYLGPTLVFIGWWWLLRKLVRVGKVHRITSIADLISSRYGKSPSLGVLVTLIALIATTPYIALQLQSVTRSYQVIVGEVDVTSTAFFVAAGMALFTILFGTRNLDANERHHGVVAAIALEAVVKLFALLAVGLFVVFGVAGGIGNIFEGAETTELLNAGDVFNTRWVVLTFLSATAIICLPRQFQVTVVENVDERHLSTASWLFPLYLFGMSLFVLPIAIAGLKFLPPGSNPDLYVLTLPLSLGRQELALLAFLGGFSSATSMVIVAAIAVSTMVSNHIVMPMVLRFFDRGSKVSGDVRNLLLTSRRISIAAVLGLGFLYFQVSGGSDALAAIGLIAFVGVAQFMPSLVIGLFWRGATRSGALAGMIAGFLLWAYTLFLPSFGGGVILNAETITHGLFNIGLLTPHALLGLEGLDPLVHAVVWSLGANTILYIAVSCFTHTTPMEHLQSALFVNVFRQPPGEIAPASQGSASSEDLFILAQRIMGTQPARGLFDELAMDQGRAGSLPEPTQRAIDRIELELAGSIGAASAHAMVRQITGQVSIDITELMNIADETQELMETYRQLSEKSYELTEAMKLLSSANERLRRIDAEKDDFLNQVSHELRTPMTSIRSFSEILLGADDVSAQEREKFLNIIHDESQRLTRLLDEILDINTLQHDSKGISLATVSATAAIDAALASVDSLLREKRVRIELENAHREIAVLANSDRLRQVLINLLSNAVKYNDSAEPQITIRTLRNRDQFYIDVMDNGGGVDAKEALTVFEKFQRGNRSNRGHGAGLGLPISRSIMRNMGGDLTIEFSQRNMSYFRMHLQVATPQGT